MRVVDRLECVEIEKRQREIGAVLLGATDLVPQPAMEKPIVVKSGQIVAPGQLARANRIERVLDRRRNIAGKNLQELEVARYIGSATASVDQLEHAADGFAH